MTSPPVREGPHEKGYMMALAQHVKLYGSVDETTLAEAPSAVAEEVVRALADGTPLHVFPDPHSKRLATIMQPFLTKVVEGGDVYNRG